jgi:hypothetical protein
METLAEVLQSGVHDTDRPVHALEDRRHQFRAKVQPVGDHCEVSIKSVDVDQASRLSYLAWTGEVRRGPREPGAERDPEDAVRSARRARQMLRLRATHMGCDRLFTLTARGLLASRDEARECWSAFARLMRVAFPSVEWIAVPEPHSDGLHWHVHFASRGFLNVNVLRRMWHAVLQRRYELSGPTTGKHSPGNVDVSYRGAARGVKLVRKIAAYLAKYLGKSAEAEFNRKRYWQSMGIELPKAHYIWLGAEDLPGAILQAMHAMGHVHQDGTPAFEAWTPSLSFAWYWVEPSKLPSPPF